MSEIKKLLRVRNIEDYYGYKIIFDLIVFCFLIFLGTGDLQLQLTSHLMVLFWISINTYQLFTLFERKKCDFIFCQSYITNEKRFFTFLKACIIENILFLLFIFVYLMIIYRCNFINGIIVTLIHFFFAIALGVFVSQINLGSLRIIFICFYYMINFYTSSAWTTDEFSRYISVTIQLYNISKFNISNNFSLLMILIILLMISLYLSSKTKKLKFIKKIAIITLSVCTIVVIVRNEIYINTKIEEKEFNNRTIDESQLYYKGIDENSALILSGLVSELERKLTELGILDKKSKEYIITRYYVSYLYPLYKTRPIPIVKNEDSISINIFSDAMINFKEDDLIRDFVNRLFDQIEINIDNIDNTFIFQFMEGCREQIFIDILSNNKNISSNDLINLSNELIENRVQSETTQSNFVKKIINIMYYKYPYYMSELYMKLQNELPNNHQDFINILKKDFPELLEDTMIKDIIESVIRR